MSAPIESGGKTISISFTALLYGVVIDAALHRVHDLALTPANLLLFISLGLVVQDFFFYHEDMKQVNLQFLKRTLENEADPALDDQARRRRRVEAEQSKRRKERKIFFFDAILLATWYVLSLAAHEPVAVYLLWLAVFFLSVALWETFAIPPTHRRELWAWARGPEFQEWLRCTHWPVGIATALAAAVAWNVLQAPVLGESDEMTFAHWTWKEWVLLAAPLALFLGWRAFYWVQLRNKVNDSLEKSIELIAPIPVDVEKGIGGRIDLLGSQINLFVDEKFVALQNLIKKGPSSAT